MSSEHEPQWVTLARVVRPQGRRGEVLCDLFTDFPERLRELPQVHLRRPDLETTAIIVEDVWLPTGKSSGRVVLKLAGIDSISQAETLLHAEIQIQSDQRVTLSKGNHYVSDLIGCGMWNRGERIGMVIDMQFPQNPAGHRLDDAASLFVVARDEGDEVMIPFVNAFVRSMDLEAKRIEMDLPDGLLSMNG